MEELLNFIEQNKSTYLDELMEFLRIPSISSVPHHRVDMENCAHWLSEYIKRIGIEDTAIVPTSGHPIVYSQWMDAGADAPTVLIYGHYDVQPVDPVDLWDTPPFDPHIRDGKIYARGSADDKGQVFIHLKALEAYFKKDGKLPVNVKLLIEGEEEAGSSNLDEFILNNAERLSCDVAMISDTEWFADGLPSICYGLRGLAYMEFTVTGPNRDLHSGTYGGAIENPINALCWIVTQMKDRYGRIRIPGFYENIVELTEKEREEYKRLPYNEEEYKKDLDIKNVFGEIGFTTLERTWARPTLDLNGIYGGYTGEGAKTVLPSKATAKFSMRLVPNQNPDDIAQKAEKFLNEIAPPTVKVEVKNLHGGLPVLVPFEGPGIKAAIEALKRAFGKEPVFMREGGSIPIVELFSRVLNAPTVLMGFGLPNDNIHSPNESFSIENFYGGIKAAAIFLDEYGKLK